MHLKVLTSEMTHSFTQNLFPSLSDILNDDKRGSRWDCMNNLYNFFLSNYDDVRIRCIWYWLDSRRSTT
jgi:hypothetical protein